MTGKKRILVVDDQRQVAKVVGSILEEAGFDVLVETDALEALDAVRKARFDLVVTDFVLESMTGLELVAQMPTYSPRAPIVMISGSDHSGVKGASERRGIDAFLPKPINRKSLLETVNRLLGGPPAPSEA